MNFTWNKPVPVGREIYWVTVAPIVAVAALPIAVVGTPVAWHAFSNPYVQAMLTGDIAGAYAYEYATGQYGAAEYGAGAYQNSNMYSSTEQVNTATGLSVSNSIDQTAAKMDGRL